MAPVVNETDVVEAAVPNLLIETHESMEEILAICANNIWMQSHHANAPSVAMQHLYKLYEFDVLKSKSRSYRSTITMLKALQGTIVPHTGISTAWMESARLALLDDILDCVDIGESEETPYRRCPLRHRTVGKRLRFILDLKDVIDHLLPLEHQNPRDFHFERVLAACNIISLHRLKPSLDRCFRRSLEYPRLKDDETYVQSLTKILKTSTELMEAEFIRQCSHLRAKNLQPSTVVGKVRGILECNFRRISSLDEDSE